jgi:N-methylhydantoinase A/oxoprolinase/acetone carboxylase beta subunit
MRVAKVPTVPAHPSEGFMNGLAQAFTRSGVDPASVGFAVHGTTVATIIQGKRARAALIASIGLGDVLEIGYQTRPQRYEIFCNKPKPLIAPSPNRCARAHRSRGSGDRCARHGGRRRRGAAQGRRGRRGDRRVGAAIRGDAIRRRGRPIASKAT